MIASPSSAPIRARAPLVLLVAWALGTAGAVTAQAQPTAEDRLARLAAAELGRHYDEELVRESSGSPSAAVRRAAARTAGRLKEVCAVSLLLGMLDDAAGPVRRSALFALGQIGDPGALVDVRSRLGRMSPSDLPFALEALGKLGDPRALPDLVARLRHAEVPVRASAALALARLADAAALPELFAALARERQEPARWPLVYACWTALRRRAREEGKPIPLGARERASLRSAAASRRPLEERIFALRALASAEGERDFLSQGLEDAQAPIVLETVRALARPWDAETAARMLPLLDHEDPLLREAALDHIVAGGKQARDLLEQALERTFDDPVRRLYVRAAEAAAPLGAFEPTPPPTTGGGEVDEWEEVLVWRVNSHFAASEGYLPETPPLSVRGRQAAAEVCGEDRVPADRAIPILLALLGSEDYTVQTLAIGSLAKRGGPEHADRVVAAARAAPGTGRMDVRIAAAEALAAWKHDDPWLREAAAEDPDAPVRAAARAALEALGRPLPPRKPRSGFRLHGHDAGRILDAARSLHGARVRLETNRGTLELMLLPDEAPAHCVNFAVLVREGFYDGLTWHRVVGNFVVQGGCPRGDGWGGPGYALPDEIGMRPYVRGTVGMPKSGDDTGGCQLFVTHLPTPHLDGRYTVFAQVVSGLDVLDRIRVDDRIERAVLLVPAEENGR